MVRGYFHWIHLRKFFLTLSFILGGKGNSNSKTTIVDSQITKNINCQLTLKSKNLTKTHHNIIVGKSAIKQADKINHHLKVI